MNYQEVNQFITVDYLFEYKQWSGWHPTPYLFFTGSFITFLDHWYSKCDLGLGK